MWKKHIIWYSMIKLWEPVIGIIIYEIVVIDSLLQIRVHLPAFG